MVFTRHDGKPVNPRNFSKEFSRIVARAGLPSVTFHGLRHIHISQLLRDGVHAKVVSERAGHSSVSVTLDIFSHVIANMREDATMRVDEAMRRALEE
jgi:integrase